MRGLRENGLSLALSLERVKEDEPKMFDKESYEKGAGLPDF